MNKLSFISLFLLTTLCLPGCMGNKGESASTAEKIIKYQDADPLSQWVSKNLPPEKVDTGILLLTNHISNYIDALVKDDRPAQEKVLKQLESSLSKKAKYGTDFEQHLLPEENEILISTRKEFKPAFNELKLGLISTSNSSNFDAFFESYLKTHCQKLRKKLYGS